MKRTITAALALPLLALAAGCGTPQVGADREALKAVEGLFTAVSLQDPNQLQVAEAKLGELKAAGKVPEAVAEHLASIGEEARGGDWSSARDQLRTFMEYQHP